MPTPPLGAERAVHPSSVEGFLDDYQLVRIAMVLGGFAHLGLFGWHFGWQFLLPYLFGLAITGGHAVWSRWRDVRSPRLTLVLDLTLWGGVMVLIQEPTIETALLAFLAVVSIVFARGWPMAAALTYGLTWYLISYFADRPFSLTSISELAAIVLVVGGLAAMVHRMRSWLARLDATRSQMLGTVSHELRNSLTGTLGLTDIVSTDLSMGIEKARELISMAHEQAVDASAIVEDLLVASRLGRSALKVSQQTVDIREDIATIVRRFAGDGVDITARVDESLPLASGDSLRIRQILRNLASNAVRYGGPSIHVVGSSEGDEVHITVADNGDGVPSPEKSTIFLPYRRSSTSHHPDSVGLGLWISRELARAMNGDLHYGRKNGWTEFTLTLPMSDVSTESVAMEEVSS